MEQEQQQTQRPTITLEPLDQGGITLHFDELTTAIRASIPDCTERIVANAMTGVRGKQLLAWAIWVGEMIHGYVLTQPMNAGYSGKQAMLIYALYSNDLTLDQWQEAISQLRDILREVGYIKICAITNNDRVREIVSTCGWKTSTYCELEV